MKCASCGNRAIFAYETERGPMPVCLDCNLKFQQAETLEHDRLVRTHNLLVGMMEDQVGLPRGTLGHRPDVTPRPLHTTAITMNNIQIADSTIGVLNTGTIQTVDAAVTVLKNSGEQEAATALAKLTEGIIKSDGISAKDKDQLLELLSVISTEGTAPKEKRRLAAMRPILGEIATMAGGIASAAQLWSQYGARITSLFS